MVVVALLVLATCGGCGASQEEEDSGMGISGSMGGNLSEWWYVAVARGLGMLHWGQAAHS